MSLLVPTPCNADSGEVMAAVHELVGRHGVLRSRLIPEDDELEVLPATTASATVRMIRVDALHLDQARLHTAARDEAARTALAPERGEMLRAVWFDAGAMRPGRLLLTMHHFCVDGVSLRILASELTRLLAGESLPAPDGAPFGHWARLLREDANSPEREAELGYWQRLVAGPTVTIGAATPPVGAARTSLTVALPPELTRPLLTTVPAANGCDVVDVLVTGLVDAVIRIGRDRGQRTGATVLLQLEGHGRALPGTADPVDLARTIGWFTNQYPVRVTLPETDLATALRATTRQLRETPGDRLGYGQLRYLNPRTAARLAGSRQPELRLNYLGRIGTASAGIGAGTELLGDLSQTPARFPLHIDAVAEDGPTGPQLLATWTWPVGALHTEHVRALADAWFTALRALAELTVPNGHGSVVS